MGKTITKEQLRDAIQDTHRAFLEAKAIFYTAKDALSAQAASGVGDLPRRGDQVTLTEAHGNYRGKKIIVDKVFAKMEGPGLDMPCIVCQGRVLKKNGEPGVRIMSERIFL